MRVTATPYTFRSARLPLSPPRLRMPYSPDNLPRFLTEAIVIVGSILLAFAIDAGWEASRESEARRAALVDLRSELSGSVPLMDTTLARMNEDLALMRGMLSDVEEVVGRLEPSTYGDVVEAIFRPNTADDNATAIVAVLEDPRIRDLPDDGFRTGVATWRQHRTEVEERGGTIVRMEGVTLERLALDPAIQDLFAGYGRGVDAEWTRPISSGTLRALASDPETRAMMARKALQAGAQLNWLLQLQIATADLMSEVDRVLGGY